LRFREYERFAVCDLPEYIEGAGTPFEEPNNFLVAAPFKPQAAARAMWRSLLSLQRAPP
jgi:hypothetical protein